MRRSRDSFALHDERYHFFWRARASPPCRASAIGSNLTFARRLASTGSKCRNQITRPAVSLAWRSRRPAPSAVWLPTPSSRIRRLPGIESPFRHTVFAAEIRALRACFVLLQDADDLLVGSNCSLHRPSLPWGGPSSQFGGKISWRVNRALRALPSTTKQLETPRNAPKRRKHRVQNSRLNKSNMDDCDSGDFESGAGKPILANLRRRQCRDDCRTLGTFSVASYSRSCCTTYSRRALLMLVW